MSPSTSFEHLVDLPAGSPDKVLGKVLDKVPRCHRGPLLESAKPKRLRSRLITSSSKAPIPEHCAKHQQTQEKIQPVGPLRN